MKYIIKSRLIAVLLLLMWTLPNLRGQSQASDPQCTYSPSGGVIPQSAFFNYGSGQKMRSSTRRMKLTVGQPVVGIALGDQNNMSFGYWAGLLVAPYPPMVTATQGDLLDRIQISWAPNPLGAYANGGFKIYRDGVFLASVDKNTRNYNDFNVIAGQPYNYEVRGINVYGEGSPGRALGFQVPNGVVTGWVRTTNGNAVPNALVTLMPMQGFSARFGPFDGAFANGDTSAAGHFLPLNSGGDWTLAFWIKNQSASGNPIVMEMPSANPLTIRTINGSALEVNAAGAVLNGSFGGNAALWQHITLTYSSNQYRLYIDGVLVDQKNGTSILTSPDLLVGARSSQPGWEGRLDELRIYHLRLDELDLPEVMEGTASSLTNGLKYYWKMDEERGTKSFDVLHRNKLFFCGAVFDNDRPPVRTSGMTNEDGYYRIESANYGTGTTFLAEPMKNFYLHRAVKFTRAEEDYATLPDFSVTGKATLETWVNSAGPDGTQTILSKNWSGNNSFQLQLEPNGNDNDIIFKLNNQAQNFGLLGLGYHHLAFTLDSTGAGIQVRAFKDGVLLGQAAMPSVAGSWSDPAEPWVLGARKSGPDFVDFYGGLIDEVAVYDTILADAGILQHAQQSRDLQERRLRIYYAMDEGTGNQLNNAGSVLLPNPGMTFGTSWTIMAPNQSATPHEFLPGTRQVTLNPSVTSVDQVDFTDRSTIPVSGFVRYQNTDCFAEKVEILVNGESFSPAIYTDSTGKFTIDLEPGATVNLSPIFEDHQFFPATWTVTNVTSPIAGILFNDITTRSVSGVVAGGDCHFPITAANGFCIIKLRSLDGCFEKNFEVQPGETEYEFTQVPPLEMTVAVTEFSDPVIKTAFEVSGGKQIDLTSRDTIIDLLYFAPPQVEVISGLDPIDPPNCNTIVLEKGGTYTMVIRLTEFYLGQGCPLDTGNIRIINDVAGSVKDTVLSSTTLQYKFVAGIVNPSPPFLQNIQVIGANLAGNESSLVKQVLVTGLRSKANTFTTQLPGTPTVVLRDPPGDGSYAFLEKNQKICKTVSATLESEVGGGGGLVIDLSPEVNVVEAPLGLGFWHTMGGGVVITLEGQATFQRVTEKSFEYCTSFAEKISTSAEDLIVGTSDSIPYYPPESAWINGGDLFVGSGLNVEFGFADEVSFNDTICSGEVDVKLAVSPQNFGTNFMYTDYHIRNNVIRYLQNIADSPDVTPEKRDTCLKSIARWQTILNNNKKQIQAAKFIKNVSFDAGIQYEYAETSDTTNSNSTNTAFNTEGSLDVSIGFDLFGAGVTGNVKFVYSTSKGEGTATGTEKGITTGYVLADNDPGDAFTIDIAMDTVYKTPVFRTVSGQSSCPWEFNTAHREGNSMEFRDGSGAIAVDVPSNEAAVFKFTLGNESETNETWTYAFTAGPESNPDGAKIFLNGGALDKPVMYAIPYGESVPVTITVERGPEAYNYDSLEIVFYSLCEDERANALGILPDLDTILYSAQYISVHFIEPCSEVDINVPQQDWVVFPDPITSGPDDVMRITVSGYDKVQDQFDSIRVQYRRSDGDGAWINIAPPVDSLINSVQPGAEISRENLGSVFTQFYWDTDGLADGPYEIRAVSLCSDDASDKPGYSHVIKGRIERQPPSLIGVPEPSDGVYQVGDEISFSFNKHINCNKINAVDNVLLFDATTGLPIDIDITCFENKIILNPNFQNQFFENRILRAELHDIEDKTGNNLIYEQWEFYVDRNELAWLTDSLGMTKFEDETKTVTANIHNRGGYPTPFTITNVPSWVHVVPNQGTLAANEIRPISFTVDSTLAFGLWSDSITLHTNTGQNPFFMGGDEGLPLGVRVVCRPPNWNINANLFENTMNMVAVLNIQGDVSTDVEDMVVAFIGDTIVGRARVQYIPQVDKYLAYLTIYGNPTHVLLPIRLEIWDASECLRYAVLEDYFTFQPDVVIGNPLAPQVLHTTSYVVRDVPLGFGWNWMSFNLAFPNPDLDSALVSLNHPQNDLMKGQNAFSIYFNGGGWLGSLNTLNNNTMYVYRADVPDTLRMLGNLLDPSSMPIPLAAGWNWIGYIPNYSLPINDALSSVPAQTGDLIKSQVSFAQYINPQFGWIGNLKYMQPPNGYQLKIATPGTLIYPPPPSNKTAPQGQHQQLAADSRGPGEENVLSLWSVNPTQYEYSMTLIGMVKAENVNITTATMELGVFVGAEVRGSAQAIYIEPLDAYQFFLTSYANVSGEQLKFKIFDSSTGTVHDLNEVMYFAADLHQGSIEMPVPFTMGTSATNETSSAQLFEIQPNPFLSETVLRYVVPTAQDVQVTITNAGGRKVASMRTSAQEGVNVMVWRGQSDDGERLASGVYFIRLQTENGSVVKKVVLQ